MANILEDLLVEKAWAFVKAQHANKTDYSLAHALGYITEPELFLTGLVLHASTEALRFIATDDLLLDDFPNSDEHTKGLADSAFAIVSRMAHQSPEEVQRVYTKTFFKLGCYRKDHPQP